MGHIHRDVSIEAPVEDVFAIFCDPARHRDLDPEIELPHLNGPMSRAGTTFDSTMRVAGIERTEHCMVVKVSSLRMVHVRGTSADGETSDMVCRFEPEADGVRFAVDLDYEVPGVFGRLIDRVALHGALDAHVRRMNENLKALAERKAPVPV